MNFPLGPWYLAWKKAADRQAEFSWVSWPGLLGQIQSLVLHFSTWCSSCNCALMAVLEPRGHQGPHGTQSTGSHQGYTWPGKPTIWTTWGWDSQAWSHWHHFFKTSYFNIISDLQKSCKIRTKNSYIPFTQISQMLPFYDLFFSLSLLHSLALILSKLSENKLQGSFPLITKYFSICFLKTRTSSYITTIQLANSGI